MINSSLDVYGSLWYFAVWTIIGLFFYIFIAKETMGLTDIEKKTLYSPKDVGDETLMRLEMEF